MSTQKTWAEKTAAEAVKKAKAHWGGGWANLSEDMRQAYIARQVLAVIVGQDEDTMPPMMKRMVEMADLALQDEDFVKGPNG